MSQIQVKQIISSFCRILEFFNFSKVTPEDFRIAKFNKSDAVTFFNKFLVLNSYYFLKKYQVWRLLFELIVYIENDDKKILKDELKDNFKNWGPG